MSPNLAANLFGIVVGLAIALALSTPRARRWLDLVDRWVFLKAVELLAVAVPESPGTRLAAPPGGDRGPVLPPPPAERLAPAQAVERQEPPVLVNKYLVNPMVGPLLLLDQVMHHAFRGSPWKHPDPRWRN